MLKRTILLLVLVALCAPATIAAKRKKNAVQTISIPVYDTIRVVVTDTIKVEPKPAPRIDTITIAHSPADIDSLVEVWAIMHQKQGEKRFFDLYAGEEDSLACASVDSLYKQRLQDLMSPMHLPYNYIVRNFINQYLAGRWSPLRNVLALSKYYFPIIEEELIAAGLPLELRYLPIIESNLSSRATSRMGAVGLWQFMPATGKNLGLEINSLRCTEVDTRCVQILSPSL